MAATRYSRVAITLHWLIALAVIAMAPMGWWMTYAVNDADRQQAAYQVFQFHKSLGFTILALTVARLVWRLLHRAPPLPDGLKAWERFAAHGVHAGFYVLLLGPPPTGWGFVSAGWAGPQGQPLGGGPAFFRLFPIPALP